MLKRAQYLFRKKNILHSSKRCLMNFSDAEPVTQEFTLQEQIKFMADKLEQQKIHMAQVRAKHPPKQEQVPEILSLPEKQQNTTPLTQPFNKIELPPLKNVIPVLHLTQDSDVKITTLPNNLRVASADNHGKLGVVQVMFEAGIRHGSEKEQGLAVLLNKLSFKASENFSTERVCLKYFVVM